jgi:tetraacyldisaccharide 4'-kinase
MQSGRDTATPAQIVRILFMPLGWVFALVVLIRNLACDLHLLRRRRLPGRVISIGNISTGGTGKTPVTQFLAETLKSAGLGPAILSRGYKPAYAHSDLVFNSGQVEQENIDWLADEVVLLARRLPGFWFGVGADRYRNGLRLAERHGISLFLLDDGFQHRRLFRDLDIVLIDATWPFGNGRLLPAGNRR